MDSTQWRFEWRSYNQSVAVCVSDEQLEAVRTEMQAAVSRLDAEVSELQQSRTALSHDNAQQLEALERLRRENAELLQRVSNLCMI